MVPNLRFRKPVRIKLEKSPVQPRYRYLRGSGPGTSTPKRLHTPQATYAWWCSVSPRSARAIVLCGTGVGVYRLPDENDLHRIFACLAHKPIIPRSRATCFGRRIKGQGLRMRYERSRWPSGRNTPSSRYRRNICVLGPQTNHYRVEGHKLS